MYVCKCMSMQVSEEHASKIRAVVGENYFLPLRIEMKLEFQREEFWVFHSFHVSMGHTNFLTIKLTDILCLYIPWVYY